MVLLHDCFKSAESLKKQNRLHTTYLKEKKPYRSKVSDAKKAYNVKVIEESPNTCKAAWEIINNKLATKQVQIVLILF